MNRKTSYTQSFGGAGSGFSGTNIPCENPLPFTGGKKPLSTR